MNGRANTNRSNSTGTDMFEQMRNTSDKDSSGDMNE